MVKGVVGAPMCVCGGGSENVQLACRTVGGMYVRVGWVPGECAAGRAQTPRGWSSCQVGISAQKGLLICTLPPKRLRR